MQKTDSPGKKALSSHMSLYEWVICLSRLVAHTVGMTLPYGLLQLVWEGQDNHESTELRHITEKTQTLKSSAKYFNNPGWKKDGKQNTIYIL